MDSHIWSLRSLFWASREHTWETIYTYIHLYIPHQIDSTVIKTPRTFRRVVLVFEKIRVEEWLKSYSSTHWVHGHAAAKGFQPRCRAPHGHDQTPGEFFYNIFFPDLRQPQVGVSHLRHFGSVTSRIIVGLRPLQVGIWREKLKKRKISRSLVVTLWRTGAQG